MLWVFPAIFTDSINSLVTFLQPSLNHNLYFNTLTLLRGDTVGLGRQCRHMEWGRVVFEHKELCFWYSGACRLFMKTWRVTNAYVRYENRRKT